MRKENSYSSILTQRESFSRTRLTKLRNRIKTIKELSNFPNLTIFGAGSYARLEASPYSDIDMFFLDNALPDSQVEPRTSRILLFARVIDHVSKMQFEQFSNDGEYLEILNVPQMLESLGGRNDDYSNYFTARMLLLLESKCLWHDKIYNKTIYKIVASYFRDYPKHKSDFKPIFLINDIARYWKTLCLNYEHKRNQPVTDQARLVKQKVRNFKLKFSRMTTCFATIALLSCQLKSLTIRKVCDLMLLTPRERLNRIPDYVPESRDIVAEILTQYSWFLKMTELSTRKLEQYFSNEDNRIVAFDKANVFGDKMFELLEVVDKKYNLLRYLVI